MRTAWYLRVQLRWVVPFGVLIFLLVRAFSQAVPAGAAPTVTSASTFQWLESVPTQTGTTTWVHLGGEVTNTNTNNPADMVEVNYLLYAGSAVIGPETAYVWENGAHVLGPGQTTPYRDDFPAPPGYTNAVIQSITAADPGTPPDQNFSVILKSCTDFTDVNHVCGTITNNNGTTVDNVRAILTFQYTDTNNQTTTVDEDVASPQNNESDSLGAGASADFELVRSTHAPAWNGTPLVFAESTTTVPAAPADAFAVEGNGQATVSWNPPSDGGRQITGYTVTASCTAPSCAGGQTASVNGNTTSATVTGLSNGTTYTFSVTATNAVGTSYPSAPSNAVTPATAPDKPTNVAAAISSSDPHTAVVSWAAPFNEGRTITKYTVTASTGGLSATVTGNPPATQVEIPGLVTGTSYTFTVTATNALGTSPPSDPSNAVTPPGQPPSAPSNVVPTGGFGYATVNWSPSTSDPSFPLTGYTVTASPGGRSTSVGPNQTSAMIAGLAQGNYTFTVTASNASGSSSATSGAIAVTAGGQYHALPAPARRLDTRDGTGNVQHGPVGAGQTITVPMLGQDGVPGSGVAAVVMNVTVTQGTAPSYLSVFPSGSVTVFPPPSSNLNWVPGQDVPNLVIAQLGGDGAVTAYNHDGTVHVIFDIQGWISTPDNSTGTSGQLRPMVPSRLLDTRAPQTYGYNSLGTGSTINLTVAGVNNVPANASAVVLNVTATNSNFAGYVTVWPAGQPQPTASNLNVRPGLNVSNRVVVGVGANGQISFFNYAGHLDLVVDLNGWYTNGSDPAATGGEFTGLTPYRILDTRQTHNAPGNSGKAVVLVAGTSPGIAGAGVPAGNQASAVALNVTATNTSCSGYVSAYPSDASQPNSSDVNWIGAGQTVPNLVIVKLSGDGKVTLFNYCGPTDLVVDVLGWYSAPAS